MAQWACVQCETLTLQRCHSLSPLFPSFSPFCTLATLTTHSTRSPHYTHTFALGVTPSLPTSTGLGLHRPHSTFIPTGVPLSSAMSLQIYDFVSFCFTLILDIFFREIRPRGVHKIPKKGPVIFVAAPHANQVKKGTHDRQSNPSPREPALMNCSLVCRSYRFDARVW